MRGCQTIVGNVVPRCVKSTTRVWGVFGVSPVVTMEMRGATSGYTEMSTVLVEDTASVSLWMPAGGESACRST